MLAAALAVAAHESACTGKTDETGLAQCQDQGGDGVGPYALRCGPNEHPACADGTAVTDALCCASRTPGCNGAVPAKCNDGARVRCAPGALDAGPADTGADAPGPADASPG